MNKHDVESLENLSARESFRSARSSERAGHGRGEKKRGGKARRVLRRAIEKIA